jgi:hypothetical protein
MGYNGSMHRNRLLFPFLFGVALIPLSVFAAVTDNFGPIVPKNIQTCAAGWGGLVSVVGGLLSFAISLGVIIAVLMFAYAGFLWVLNPVSPENRSTARKILINAAIGLVLTLSAWLIVNTLLNVIGAGGIAGATKTLFSGGANSPCITEQPGTGAPPSGPTGAPGVAPPLSGTGACDANIVKSAAQSGGYTLTDAQAQTFACIARPESSCGNNISGATQKNGTPTSAYGAFQVILGINDTCHNLNIPVCEQIAGVSGNLNCSSAFSHGSVKPGMERLAATCQAAASNLTCNTAAAACLLQAEPTHNFSDWTADPRSQAQQACVSTYNH